MISVRRTKLVQFRESNGSISRLLDETSATIVAEVSSCTRQYVYCRDKSLSLDKIF